MVKQKESVKKEAPVPTLPRNCEREKVEVAKGGTKTLPKPVAKGEIKEDAS